MIKLLEKAIAEISKLPKQEQDTLATWILEELASEQRWGKAFGESRDQLAKLADEALDEHREGKTQPFDLEKL